MDINSLSKNPDHCRPRKKSDKLEFLSNRPINGNESVVLRIRIESVLWIPQSRQTPAFAQEIRL
ncbi:hypothetical protein C4Q31_05280 [Leptospira borgpetersenii serovar Ceylonica]|uniref:Uncharacterized protein n=3 Tax=Leptospira borgpetersenii TaxID=174 RepID=M3H3A6_LEPBO|nr:hypothetical protein C4Q31_05280 [Leptospira borgpetersenii serovar Ceylonica]EKP14556.1 hypothetical protein LEP1GSC128_1637 [Leptospira borgpetersenii str. 200801926]EMG01554.1 hypothetical protein LEP1GSC123_2559 [Leptospira borgpetersenii str. 200701203]EMN17153.1 hypothetical protein LEP1GSC056_0529 [Leptospira borgpetersenii str. Brem 328]EMN58139.1 hypothetical protein LEP1GSC090_3824 [Leptospira borgpetersenii serovar Javanica str. MK146]OOV43693.1 hypothetical protein B1H38_11755 [